MARPTPTGNERTFDEGEIIVSKTDLKGRMTYVNRVFCKVGLYSEMELIGQPHSIVRHPDMPRCVFQLLWQRIQAGQEIFAYVKNMAKNGDHYWVLAHVTPSYSSGGEMDGYHSNRRVPERRSITAVEPLYRELLRIESSNHDPRAGMAAGRAALDALLQEKGVGYDEFLFSITN